MEVDLLASGSLDSKDTSLDVEEGDIESTTTEIVDENVALLLRLTGTKTVGNGGSSGLVDDTEDVETGNGTGVLGGLSLVVVEVGRDSDDGLLDLLAELGLGNLLHLFGGVSKNCTSAGAGKIVRTLVRTMEEISWAENCLVSPRYSTSILGLPLSSTILKGQDSMSFLTVGSSKRRPIRRLRISVRNCDFVRAWRGENKTHLASKTVLRGFMAALFLAASPIRRSLSVKETKEGVVKEPCSLAMISTLVPS